MLAMLLALAAPQAVAQHEAPDGAIRRIAAPEAMQGVAASKRYLYAISTSSIGLYDKDSGKRLAKWRDDPKHYRHFNSCTLANGELVCAVSNFPNLPMTSTVEYFDAETLRPLRTHDFGEKYGSLTWIDWYHGKWWACFANYDAPIGQPGRDHRATVLVRYSTHFDEEQSWSFPSEVLARFAPMSSSGGDWHRDGFLYVTGHERHELYVLKAPANSPRLTFVKTLPTVTGGQAFDWDPDDERVMWSIDRKARQIVASRIEEVVER